MGCPFDTGKKFFNRDRRAKPDTFGTKETNDSSLWTVGGPYGLWVVLRTDAHSVAVFRP